MRSAVGFSASAVAGLAAVISSLDGDSDLVPFFVGWTFAGGVIGWATHSPFTGGRVWAARAIAGLWVLAAVVATVLLVIVAIIGDGPSPAPEATYVAMTATAYHLIGLYGGAFLAACAAFPGPGREQAEPQARGEHQAVAG